MAAPTFYRRPLPDDLVAFASPEGRTLFREALALGGMEGWFALAEHYHTQSEPAFCGLGSLVVVLNALAIDPARPWKGVWRWYGEELLDCCDPLDVVRVQGLTLQRLACLARCNGATATVRHADAWGLDTLRNDVVTAAAGGPPVIAAFARTPLGQTGDGHYSPLGGWHSERELVLVLDVARFKYPPFWVPLARLHTAMQPADPQTSRARGWLVLDREGTHDTRAYRIACETPGWREAVDALRAHLQRLVTTAPPATAEALVSAVAAAVPTAARTLLVPREGGDPEVGAALRRSGLARGLPGEVDAAPVILLVLAAPPGTWAPLPAAVREGLAAAMQGLDEPARAEVARLTAQLAALSA